MAINNKTFDALVREIVAAAAMLAVVTVGTWIAMALL
jgi:hypothetical protein